MFLASENIDFTGLSHVFLLGGGELNVLFSYVFVIMKSRESKAWGVFFIDEREKGLILTVL